MKEVSLSCLFALLATFAFGDSEAKTPSTIIHNTCPDTDRQRRIQQSWRYSCIYRIETNIDQVSYAILDDLCRQQFGRLAEYIDNEDRHKFENLTAGFKQKMLMSNITDTVNTYKYWELHNRTDKTSPISTLCRSECPNPSKLAAEQKQATEQHRTHNQESQQKLAAKYERLAALRESQLALTEEINWLGPVLHALETARPWQPICPPLNATALHTGWHPFASGCFLVILAEVRHGEADGYCGQLGGRMAALHDGPETRFVKQLLRRHTKHGVAWADRWWSEPQPCHDSSGQSRGGVHCRCQVLPDRVPWRQLNCLELRPAVCQLRAPLLVPLAAWP